MKTNPEIIAELTLFTTDHGGRNAPIPKGEYRGVLGVATGNYSARFDVNEDSGFQLGTTAKLGIQFLDPVSALLHFPVDSEFTIWEGGAIGKGKVLQVLIEA